MGFLYVLTRDCKEGAIVTVTPVRGINLGRVVRGTQRGIVAIQFGVVQGQRATIRAWHEGRYLGSAEVG